MKTETKLIIALGIFFGILAFMVYDDHTATCDQFSGRAIKDLPARCLKFYLK